MNITTYTGRSVDPLNATTEDINVHDIAHALARQCRYNGHVEGFLSVARHSIMVSNVLEREGHLEYARQGLLHDATEAYLGDLVKPLKDSEELHAFDVAEHRLEQVIFEVFDLEYPLPQVIKDADVYVATELEMPQPRGMRWTYHGHYGKDEADFLERYYDVTF